MKIFTYARPYDHISIDKLTRFIRLTEESGMQFCINREFADRVYENTGVVLHHYTDITECDLDKKSLMMAIGGDGTLLQAVQRLKGLPIPIVGVNMGRLGFLAGISPYEFREALEDIKQGNYSIERRPMLTASGDFGCDVEFPCALNEFTIHRHNASMVEVTIHADGLLIAVARGDGVIIATPTGSTAYSLSAGGPIIVPQCSCFVLTAIAPHNFTMRPLVLPNTSVIELEIRSRGNDVAVSLDNQSFIVGDGARFTVKKAVFSTFLVHLQNISFYDTLKNKMMWGLDKRDSAVKI